MSLASAFGSGRMARVADVQFHPEFKSRPFAPHPLFAPFVEAAVEPSRPV